MRYVCVVLSVIVARLEVGRLYEETAYEYHCQNHSDNSERIGHGTSQCRSAAWQTCAVECLLCRGKGRSICCRAAEYSGHVRHADAGQRTQKYCQYGADDNHGESPHVECHAFVAHHSYKARSDVQTEGIYEEQQSECLGESHHVQVCFES